MNVLRESVFCKIIMGKKSACLIFLLVLFTSITTQAQNWQNDLQEADVLFANKDFGKALTIYQKLNGNFNNPIFYYKIGLCYLESPNNKKDAASYFEKALNKNDGSIPVDVYFYLGKAYHYNYRFVDAVNTLTKYLEQSRTKPILRKKANQIIAYCQNGQKLLGRRRIDLNIGFMDFPINTSYNDFAPIVSGDEKTMFFTSDRLKNEIDLVFGDQYVFLPEGLKSSSSDIYSTSPTSDKNWRHPNPQLLESPYISTLSMADNGESLLVYIGKNENSGNFFILNKKNNGNWQKPQKINLGIDDRAKVKGACLASNGKVIYFSSNKPGGFGGYDIYWMHKIDGNRWSVPENLGEYVNSPSDEINPFLHANSTTLFFSSNGHDSMGYFDIFRSKKNGATWSKAFNLGDPINSVYNDDYFKMNTKQTEAYLSSDRNESGSFGGYDILKVIWGADPMPLTRVSGVIKLNKNGISVPIKLNVEEELTGAKQQYVYSPNPEDGKYFMVLFPNKSYSIDVIYENKLIENIKIRIDTNTFDYQYNLEINIKEVEVFGHVVADVIKINPGYKLSSKEGAEDKVRKSRYDILIEVLNKIIEYSDSTGLDSLYHFQEDPLLPKPVEVHYAIDNLLELMDTAIHKSDYNLIYQLPGPINSLVSDIKFREAYKNRAGKWVYLGGEIAYNQQEDNPHVKHSKDINEIAYLLKENSMFKIELVHVHADKYNKSLSTKRLNHLRDRFMELGVGFNQIITFDASRTSKTYTNLKDYDVINAVVYSY